MSSYWRGFVASIPFGGVVIPFGVLFGILATDAGLNVLEALAFSAAVIAGAAQLTALHLMQDDAPTLVVLASGLAVNLRVAMYSIAITPHLGPAKLWQRALAAYFLVDPTYALSHAEYDNRPEMTLDEKIGYYAGTVTIICLPWFPATAAGALLGDALPSGIGLSFAFPLCFIALFAPMLRSLPHWSAALVAITLSVLLAGLPYNLGLLVAGLGGMVAGAAVEKTLETRRAA